MIIDRLENLEKYAGAVKGLAPAARFLEGFVKTDMTPGRYELATTFEKSPPKNRPWLHGESKIPTLILCLRPAKSNKPSDIKKTNSSLMIYVQFDFDTKTIERIPLLRNSQSLKSLFRKAYLPWERSRLACSGETEACGQTISSIIFCGAAQRTAFMIIC